MNKSNQEEYSGPINFPCDFMIKVMGKANDAFEGKVYEIFHRHFPDVDKKNFSLRYSKDRNYLAISVTVHAENQPQLDSIYSELTQAPDVIMAL